MTGAGPTTAAEASQLQIERAVGYTLLNFLLQFNIDCQANVLAELALRSLRTNWAVECQIY